MNKVDFLTLLDNRTTLFNYEHEYYDSLADYQVKKAQLEALIGKSLSEIDKPSAGEPVPMGHEHGAH